MVNPSISNRPDVALLLRWQVASKLREAGLFKSIIVRDDQNADYKISINLTKVDEVQYQNRYIFGVFAGSNKIFGDVNVIDVKAGQTVRSFSFHGQSAAHPLSGKSDMKDAIHKAAEAIIKGLSEKRR